MRDEHYQDYHLRLMSLTHMASTCIFQNRWHKAGENIRNDHLQQHYYPPHRLSRVLPRVVGRSLAQTVVWFVIDIGAGSTSSQIVMHVDSKMPIQASRDGQGGVRLDQARLQKATRRRQARGWLKRRLFYPAFIPIRGA